ncbi:hypothetical protein AB0L82_06155 [Nocardia sp. NPDC052001]|uniref:hypothetical protein n=1 Tax=Nocardia sp. NPDC052001 TaxID=3154853 RepID=UPI0034212E5B
MAVDAFCARCIRSGRRAPLRVALTAIAESLADHILGWDSALEHTRIRLRRAPKQHAADDHA